MQDFRKLLIWQKGIELVKLTYKLSEQLPVQEKYGLISQINRAVVSIPSNIAEGASRSGRKDFKRFLEIAMGSAYELETQLIIIKDLKLLDKSKCDDTLKRTKEVQKMLYAFIEKL